MSTAFENGIGFVQPGIHKAYKREWAKQLLDDGTVYFTNLAVFQKEEHSQRGDPMEGTSVTIRQDVRCTASYANPIFVWCSTMESDPDVILSTWTDRDSIVEVTDTLKLAERMKDAAVARKPDFHGLYIGPVTYDKDRGSHRAYDWTEGIFQKNLRFNGQKEFRFALVGEQHLECEDNLLLKLGKCTDIARIITGE